MLIIFAEKPMNVNQKERICDLFVPEVDFVGLGDVVEELLCGWRLQRFFLQEVSCIGVDVSGDDNGADFPFSC
jgi:hypothetical protein